MEIFCASDGDFMKVSWKFDGENTRLEYGETVENRHAGKSQAGKYQNALQLRGTRTKLKGGKMFRKILDWMNTREGREVVTGIIFGAIGIFAVRVFCFLVCLATGYPADIWNIF